MLSKTTKTESSVGAYEFTTLTVSWDEPVLVFELMIRLSLVCWNMREHAYNCLIYLVLCRMPQRVCYTVKRR